MSLAILGIAAAVIAAMGLLPVVWRRASRRLRPDDRLRVGGGHEEPPPWLSGRAHVAGTVHAFLDGGPNGVVVVRLDEELTVDAPGRTASGSFAILKLRFRGARWTRSEIVSVRLGVRSPSNALEAAACALIESHAWYRRVR